MAKNVAWYFNVSKWKPTRDEWLKLTSVIDREELERINKFCYKDDSKSSLIGTALIRKFVSLAIDVPSNAVAITRTTFGRPVICDKFKRAHTEMFPKVLDFNVSHSGDYCVLAGVWSNTELEPVTTVGIDVTKIVRKKTKEDLDRFLALMSRREFTKAEWDTVERVANDRQKCINFTRLWCLKESYIKSIGLDILKNNILDSTTVLLDGQEARNWRFFETALDEEHLVAIGYNFEKDSDSANTYNNFKQSTFEEATIDSIIDSLIQLNSIDDENWTIFSSKAYKHF